MAQAKPDTVSVSLVATVFFRQATNFKSCPSPDLFSSPSIAVGVDCVLTLAQPKHSKCSVVVLVDS